MRIYVIGAGAIGTYLALLLGERCEVCVVVRSEAQAAELNERGLQLVGAILRSRKLAVVTTSDVRATADDVVISTVKTTDLEGCFDALPASFAPGLLVLAQNGLGIAAAARERFPALEIARAACWMGIRNEERGRARVFGVHSLVLGADSPRVRALANQTSAAGIPTETLAGAESLEWKKALWNLAVNPLCAVLGGKNGIVLDDPNLRASAERLLAEAGSVAKALGIELVQNDFDRVFESLQVTRENTNASLQDLQRGRRTEMDALTGYVVARGRELGIEVPASELALALVRHLERLGTAP